MWCVETSTSNVRWEACEIDESSCGGDGPVYSETSCFETAVSGVSEITQTHIHMLQTNISNPQRARARHDDGTTAATARGRATRPW